MSVSLQSFVVSSLATIVTSTVAADSTTEASRSALQVSTPNSSVVPSGPNLPEG